MKPTPPEWPRISPSLYYSDAPAAIDWLCRAFGFEVRLRIEGDAGVIHHSELVFGEGVIMVSSANETKRSPRSLGGATSQGLMVYVDDVDAHHARATAAGATVVRPLANTDYGDEWYVDRGYSCSDLEGHEWFFTQRLSDAPQKQAK